jgi:hypothetical protein
MRQLSILAAFAFLVHRQPRRAPENRVACRFAGRRAREFSAPARLQHPWSSKDNVAWRRRDQRPRLVVAGRMEQHRLCDVAIKNDKVRAHSGGEDDRRTGIFPGANDYVAELAKQGLSEDEVVKKVIARDVELTSESGDISLHDLRFDAANGKMRWEREAHKGAPFGGRHRKNTYASGNADD